MKKKKTKEEITLFNRDKMELMEYLNIGEDGTASLTGLWRYAGSPQNMEPAKWDRTEQGTRFLNSVCKIQNVLKKHIIKTKRGKNGGTYGIGQVVLEYAKYLDTDLSVLVNEVFFERMSEEKNPDLIADRMIATYKRQGKSEKWIETRIKGKTRRNELTSCLYKHGVNTPEGFKKCTNETYTPLWGGGASLVRGRKNLPAAAKIRDNMTSLELSSVEFSEALATHNIELKNIKGVEGCANECGNASRIVAKAIVDSRKPAGVF